MAKMGTIRVTNIRLRANHGCMDEEARIGGDYLVHVELTADLVPSMVSDDLNDTVDYVAVHSIVQREMAVRSKLIEHVAGRILHALRRELQGISHATVEVVKLSPPIGGDVQSVSVIVAG